MQYVSVQLQCESDVIVNVLVQLHAVSTKRQPSHSAADRRSQRRFFKFSSEEKLTLYGSMYFNVMSNESIPNYCYCCCVIAYFKIYHIYFCILLSASRTQQILYTRKEEKRYMSKSQKITCRVVLLNCWVSRLAAHHMYVHSLHTYRVYMKGRTHIWQHTVTFHNSVLI